MGVEELFEGILFTASDDFGATEIFFKCSLEDESLVVQVVSVVGDAAASSKFAGHRQFGVGTLVVPGVVALDAMGEVRGPGQLANEPFDWKPPMVSERDVLDGAILAGDPGAEGRKTGDVNVAARCGRRVTRTEHLSGRVQEGVLLDMVQDGGMISLVARAICRVGGTWARQGVRRGHSGGGGVGEVVTIHIDRVVVNGVRVKENLLAESCFDGIIDVLIIDVGIVLNGLLKLFVANVLEGLVVTRSEKGRADVQPNVDQEVLPGPGKAFAKVGKVRALHLMGTSSFFGEFVSLNIPINVVLEPSLMEKFAKFFSIGRVVEVGGDPFDAKEASGVITIELAGRGGHEVIDKAFDVTPHVVVGVRWGGLDGVQDVAEVGSYGFVVGADQNWVNGMLDHVGDGPKFGAVCAMGVGVERFGEVGFGPRGDVNSPARAGNDGMERVEGGPVGKNFNVLVPIEFFPAEIGKILVDVPVGMGFGIEDGVDAVIWGQARVEPWIIRANSRDTEGAVIA